MKSEQKKGSPRFQKPSGYVGEVHPAISFWEPITQMVVWRDSVFVAAGNKLYVIKEKTEKRK